MEATRKLKSWVVGLGILNFLLLVGVLASLLLFWKPWDPSVNANSRKISVTGTATLEAEPDEYQFNPSYTKDTTDEITKLNDQLVKTLKNLGVKDSQIKNNASRYGSPEIYYMAEPTKDSGKEKTTLSLTITVESKEMAQKVQDYLVTTNPSGSITPYATFSTEKQKELQDKARVDAIKDARKKAEQTASGLGVKIGKVIEVSEGSSSGGGCSGYGMICPAEDSVSSRDSAGKDLSVQPGTNDFTYSFTVVFTLE